MSPTAHPHARIRGSAPVAALATAGLTVATFLSGCTSDSPPRATAAEQDAPRALQPGRPGEPARTLEPGELGAAGQDDYNEADVAFVRAMIPHHAQAIEMSALAPQNGAGAQVRALAERIRGAQAPEIHALVGWLETRGLDGPAEGSEPGAHGHGGHDPGSTPQGHRMPGMLTEGQMRDLAAARGEEFDRLYLRLMIRHHQGAVTMARNLREEGTDVTLQEMADEIAVTQQDEIAAMKRMLAA